MTTLDPTVQVAIVGAFSAIVLAWIERGRRKDRRALEALSEDTKATRHHVQNDHKTNLRDDIDSVLAEVRSISEAQVRHSLSLGGIRDDLRVERQERMQLGVRLDEHLSQH